MTKLYTEVQQLLCTIVELNDNYFKEQYYIYIYISTYSNTKLSTKVFVKYQYLSTRTNYLLSKQQSTW